mgnify:CR=1 FL=1
MSLRRGGFGVWFLLAVVFGLAAAFLVASAISAASRTEKVVVAAREVAACRQLTADDLRLEEVPRAAVPRDAVRDLEQAVGKWTRGLILPGEVVRQGHLAQESGVRGVLGAKLASMGDPGIRAMALPLGNETSVGGEVREGDRVDLLAVVNVSVGGRQVTLSKVIAAGVPVLKAAEPSSDPLKPSSGGALVVAVRPDLAEDVAYVLGAGKLYVLLNPYRADESAAQTPGVVPELFLKKHGFEVAPAPGR